MHTNTRCREHDKVYSGQINLSNKFAWICMKCGECGWSEDYQLSQVNLEQYHQLRVLHGWAGPQKLPPPPRVPTNTDAPSFESSTSVVFGVFFFTLLAAACALSAIPWGSLGPILPFWMSCLTTGLALGTATVLYVCWKNGL